MKKILFLFILSISSFSYSKWCNFFILVEGGFSHLCSEEVKECAECSKIYNENKPHAENVVRFNCTHERSEDGSNIIQSPSAPDTPKLISEMNLSGTSTPSARV